MRATPHPQRGCWLNTALTKEHDLPFERQLQGIWLLVSRVIWLLFACVTLLVFVVASLHVYRFYLTPCQTWTIDGSCGRVVAWLGEQGFGVRSLAFVNLLTVVLVGLPWMTVAFLIFRQRGHGLSGWILSLALLTGWASDLTNVNVRHHFWWAFQSSGFDLGYWPHLIVYLVGFTSQVTIIVLAFLLPDGRFVPRWTFSFALLWTLYMMLETFYRYPFLVQLPNWFIVPETFFTFAAPLAAVYALWYRYRLVKREAGHAADEQKRQLETILPSMSVLGGVYFLLTFMLFILWRQEASWADGTVIRYVHDLSQNFFQAACALWFILSLTVAMFRHRLFALELLMSRTLVYGGLSAGLLGLYLLVVFGVGSLLHQTGAVWLSLVATGLIAFLFQPLRDVLQKRVSYFLYGQRNEPYEVMRQVGRQLQTLRPSDMLPALVQTLQEMLRLPYVAITVYHSPFTKALRKIEEGKPGTQVLQFPLEIQDELGIRTEIGLLEVSPRSYETLTQREQKLLEAIARQIAVASHALQLGSDLQASREKLVETREEERRRLQRDLHDSLGATLAAQTLKVGTVRSLLEKDTRVASELLQGLEKDTAASLSYVRQLVQGLRPPLLDQLGLGKALEHVLHERVQGQGLHLHLELANLPALSAALEVASYFVITEAVTNVLRHAKATRCDVSIVRSQRGLELTVQDNGIGFDPSRRREGVGLSSMRERCEEVGGKFSVSNQGGTKVWALLPIH
jgi:signal transduction histidine kinase